MRSAMLPAVLLGIVTAACASSGCSRDSTPALDASAPSPPTRPEKGSGKADSDYCTQYAEYCAYYHESCDSDEEACNDDDDEYCDAYDTECADVDGASCEEGDEDCEAEDGTSDGSDDGKADDTSDEEGTLEVSEGESCAFEFFKEAFDSEQGAEYAQLRDQTFSYIAGKVKELHECGAGVTLGGILSLMFFEGDGAKVAFFNDQCSQNSYYSDSDCYDVPKARYSYQYGLAPVHTSNFHPCPSASNVDYTQRMRERLERAIRNAGFSPSQSEIDSVAGDLEDFCSDASPTIVDYYILSAHSKFGIPEDTTGNDLKNAEKFPFFTPRVVVDLFFDTITKGGTECESLTDDYEAIVSYGGGDSSYQDGSKQEAILNAWYEYPCE